MSRHAFIISTNASSEPTPVQETPTLVGQRMLIVGWDRPLGTFFYQVIEGDRSPDAEHFLAWEGCHPGQFPRVTDLQRSLGRWATLPLHVYADLERDKQREGTR